MQENLSRIHIGLKVRILRDVKIILAFFVLLMQENDLPDHVLVALQTHYSCDGPAFKTAW